MKESEDGVLGGRLRRARLRAGFKTLRTASEATGLSLHSIKSYENNRSVPRADRLDLLAETYGVSYRWLLGKQENTDPLPAGRVLVDKALVDLVLSTKDPEVLRSYCEREPTLLLCMVEIPQGARLLNPEEALQLTAKLVAHLQKHAPFLLQSFRNEEASPEPPPGGEEKP